MRLHLPRPGDAAEIEPLAAPHVEHPVPAGHQPEGGDEELHVGRPVTTLVLPGIVPETRQLLRHTGSAATAMTTSRKKTDMENPVRLKKRSGAASKCRAPWRRMDA